MSLKLINYSMWNEVLFINSFKIIILLYLNIILFKENQTIMDSPYSIIVSWKINLIFIV